jgi:hypothetical protein
MCLWTKMSVCSVGKEQLALLIISKRVVRHFLVCMAPLDEVRNETTFRRSCWVTMRRQRVAHVSKDKALFIELKSRCLHSILQQEQSFR